jgi:pSer/pThr/pTyr-binding forkhead associated (FHA) protein
MYLKIEIDGDEKLYSFPDVNEITIGRSPDSDIQLLVEGISRNHSRVIQKQDEFFYIDIGSSRGSFINDEQLEANIESPFNTFFPIRLGESVFLYLMDEVSKEELDEAVKSAENQIDINEQVLKPKEEREKKEDPKKKHKPMIYVPESAGKIKSKPKTKKNVDSLASKKKPRTKRTPLRGKRKKKVDHTQRILVFLFVMIIIGFFGKQKYEEFKVKESERIAKIEKQKKDAIEKQKKEKERQLLLEKAQEEKLRLDRERAFVKSSIKRDKCLSTLESSLCVNFKQYKERVLYEGYIKSLTNLILVIDIDSLELFLNKAYGDDYIPSNLEKLAVLAQKEIGPSFHLGYFKNKMNLMTKKLEKDEKYYNLLMLIDLLDSGVIRNFSSISEIKILTLVGMRDQQYVQHLNLDFNAVKNLKEINDAKFSYKIYVRSAISKPLDRILSKIQLK